MAAVKSVLDELGETTADARAAARLARAKEPEKLKETTTTARHGAAAPVPSVTMLQPKKKKAKLTPVATGCCPWRETRSAGSASGASN